MLTIKYEKCSFTIPNNLFAKSAYKNNLKSEQLKTSVMGNTKSSTHFRAGK